MREMSNLKQNADICGNKRSDYWVKNAKPRRKSVTKPSMEEQEASDYMSDNILLQVIS